MQAGEIERVGRGHDRSLAIVWHRLSDGGEEGHCGWLKDRYGLSWQVVPNAIWELFADQDPEKAARAMDAILGMRKLDIAALRAAADAHREEDGFIEVA